MVSVRSESPRPRRPSRVKALLASAALLAVVAAAGCGSGDGRVEAGAPGVTDEPCPRSAHKDRGCIYLGTISDLTTGPFRALGSAVTKAQQAFWDRVNAQGGIGGYDVDVVTYVRDNHYQPQTHVRAYN